MTRLLAMSSSDASKPPRRTARGTIRSLGFASVSKALADVVSKEVKDLERKKPFSTTTSSKEPPAHDRKRIISSSLPKPSKDMGSTNDRLSRSTTPGGLETKLTARSKTPTTSFLSVKSSLSGDAGKEAITPETQATSRIATLRLRKAPKESSLPKYRPRSAIVDGTIKRPPSPVRTSARRKHSGSEDDRGNSRASTPQSSSAPSSTGVNQAGKNSNPVLKRSGKDKVSSTRDEKLSCISSDTQEFSNSSTPPPRPKKTQKSSSSPVVKNTSLPRLSSESSRTLKESPRTPTFSKSAVTRAFHVGPSGRESPTPLQKRASSTDSPLHINSPKNTIEFDNRSNENTPTAMSAKSPITAVGDISCDSQEAYDVELMLAEVASTSGPTPTPPRHGVVLYAPSPQTPSRTSLPQLSSLDLSLSPTTAPDDVASAPSISLSPRTSPGRRPSALRSSIAAWEALADLSTEINASELGGGLITEVDLSFTPGMLSPSPSIMRIDTDREGFECPTPYSLPSPGGFTSISQMLLPDSTPSPAPALRSLHSNGYFNKSVSSADSLPVDSASVTLLKLQLASAENLAKERLSQLTKLEDDLHNLTESKKRDDRMHSTEIQGLESRLREAHVLRELNLERERTAQSEERSSSRETYGSGADPEEHANCRDALEECMRLAENEKQQAVSVALTEHVERERAEREGILARAVKQQQLALTVRDAHQAWIGVHNFANTELESICTNRQTLEVLRAGLDFFEAQILISRYVRIPPPSAVNFQVG